MPLAGGGVVQGDVAWLLRPLDDEAAAVGGFEPLALAFEVPDQGALVLAQGVAQLVGGGFLRGIHAQREPVGFEAHAPPAHLFEQGGGAHRTPLT